MDIPFIKIPINQLEELTVYKKLFKNFIHPHVFKFKMPKDAYFSDFSIDEKKVELEFSNGDRLWFDFETLFGKVIIHAKELFVINENEELEEIFISSIIERKIKRTRYLNLVFSTNTKD
jgi:hypothetical protein